MSGRRSIDQRVTAMIGPIKDTYKTTKLQSKMVESKLLETYPQLNVLNPRSKLQLKVARLKLDTGATSQAAKCKRKKSEYV